MRRTAKEAPPYLLDKAQAARFLNISDGSLERLMRKGLKYVKLGGLVRFDPKHLSEFLERNTRGGGCLKNAKARAATTPGGPNFRKEPVT